MVNPYPRGEWSGNACGAHHDGLEAGAPLPRKPYRQSHSMHNPAEDPENKPFRREHCNGIEAGIEISGFDESDVVFIVSGDIHRSPLNLLQ